jgi:hypothetical protein
LATWELALFLVGIILTQVGVFMLAQREQTHYEELEDHASVNAVHPGDDTVKSHHHGSKVGVDGSNVQSGGAEGGMYLKCVWFMLSSSFLLLCNRG